MRDEDTVMLSEQLARRLQLGLEDTLSIPVPTGKWTPRIVGIYADYGNPKGHLLVNARHLLAHWPQSMPVRFNLRVD
ncbi:hypothetical protein WAI99_22175, partial [Acinetobacter baumannii]